MAVRGGPLWADALCRDCGGDTGACTRGEIHGSKRIHTGHTPRTSERTRNQGNCINVRSVSTSKSSFESSPIGHLRGSAVPGEMGARRIPGCHCWCARGWGGVPATLLCLQWQETTHAARLGGGRGVQYSVLTPTFPSSGYSVTVAP